jgi:hypothetical protein
MKKQTLKYVAIPTDLVLKKTVKGTGKNAEEVELNFLEKSFYCYMKVKYEYFKKYNKDFFESQDVFVEYLGVSKKTVQRMTANLIKAGLLSVRMTDRNNVYTVYDYCDIVNGNIIINDDMFDNQTDIPF